MKTIDLGDTKHDFFSKKSSNHLGFFPMTQKMNAIARKLLITLPFIASPFPSMENCNFTKF